MIVFIIVIAFLVIGSLLTWFLLANDQGEKEPVSALWAAAGFGLLGAVIAGFLENKLIPVNLIGAGYISLGVLKANFSVGVIEEACKFVPLALFIYKKPYFNEYKDGIIYFALAGLGFGIPENILYSLEFGSKVGLGRIFLTPLFHACTTSLVGYFLIKTKLKHKNFLQLGCALVLAMLIHGIYDFGLSSGNNGFALLSVMISAGMTITFFLLYLHAGDLDRKLFPARVQVSNFCRSCGAPNPNHNQYCTACGKHA
jgi:RsiW-degrading membrane proteinase PrsW (M82 family)